MRISRLQISSWFCIIIVLFWSWFCIQLFSRELILFINDIRVLILTNAIVDASWNGRSLSRHFCVLVNGNEPIVQIKSGIGTTLGTYFHTYLVAANESFLTLLARDDDVSSDRPSVRASCNKEQQQVVVLLSHIDELSSAVVMFSSSSSSSLRLSHARLLSLQTAR